MKNKRIWLKYFYLVLSAVFVITSLSLKLVYFVNSNKLVSIFVLLILGFITVSLMFVLKDKLKELLDLISFAIGTIILGLIITTFFILPSKIEGLSMEPTYHDKNRVFIYMYNVNYKNNDIVVYNLDELIIKRLVATEGDKIQLKYEDERYYLYINDLKYSFNNIDYYLLSPYTSVLLNTIGVNEYYLEKDEILLLGDNSTQSKDSRDTGILTTKRLVGKVLGNKNG